MNAYGSTLAVSIRGFRYEGQRWRQGKDRILDAIWIFSNRENHVLRLRVHSNFNGLVADRG